MVTDLLALLIDRCAPPKPAWCVPIADLWLLVFRCVDPPL